MNESSREQPTVEMGPAHEKKTARGIFRKHRQREMPGRLGTPSKRGLLARGWRLGKHSCIQPVTNKVPLLSPLSTFTDPPVSLSSLSASLSLISLSRFLPLGFPDLLPRGSNLPDHDFPFCKLSIDLCFS